MTRWLRWTDDPSSLPKGESSETGQNQRLTQQELVNRSATLRSEAAALQARAAELCIRAQAELERSRRVHNLRRNGREQRASEAHAEHEPPR